MVSLSLLSNKKTVSVNMKKALFGTDTFHTDFEIDIATLQNCKKGIYKLEVFVPRSSTPLMVQDGSKQLIREDYNAFVLESPVPITGGKIKFSFVENGTKTTRNTPKIATVRYLYCDES